MLTGKAKKSIESAIVQKRVFLTQRDRKYRKMNMFVSIIRRELKRRVNLT
jgi:hypothetical protein